MDAPEIEDVEAVVAEEAEGLGAVALAPASLVADEYADLGRAMDPLDREDAAVAEELVLALLDDGVACSLERATRASRSPWRVTWAEARVRKRVTEKSLSQAV